jgi:hypothetical protein
MYWQVWQRCAKLGVSSSTLRQHVDKGVKSSVIGMYRVVQYTVMTEMIESGAFAVATGGENVPLVATDSAYSSQPSSKGGRMKKAQSRLCSIL